MGTTTNNSTTNLPSSPETAIMGKGKPRGLNAARKLHNHRREQKWADLSYKKRALGTAFKSSPFGGSSHAKGIVLEKVGVEAKQPNSAIRKCVRVQLIKNGKKGTAFVPNDGCLNFVDENDEVLLAGFGRHYSRRRYASRSEQPYCPSHRPRRRQPPCRPSSPHRQPPDHNMQLGPCRPVRRGSASSSSRWGEVGRA